jgi:putative flippase GtrA
MTVPLFVRFLCVGVLNSAFGYGVFSLLIYAGMHYAPALLFATISGVLFNFKSTGSLVFKSHDNKLIFRFIGIYTIIYLVNLVGLKLLSFINVNIYFGGAILLFPMAVLAFILNKRFVFNYD